MPNKKTYHYSSIDGLALLLGEATDTTQRLVDIAIQALRRGLTPTSRYCNRCRHQLVDQGFDTVIPYYARR